MTTVEHFLKHEITLPSAPGIAMRIIDMVQGEDFSFNQLGSVIQSDPALATKILRLVNSGYYGLPQKIAGIEMAVGLLGANAVKNIALSFTIANVFKNESNRRFDFDRFWRRAVVTAVGADLIAKAVGFKSQDVFITALLQDIGIAMMFMRERDGYQRVLDQKAATGRPATVIEREIHGFDHQELGSELLRNWRLPESVYLPIRFHHEPNNAPASIRTLCHILQAADRISAGYHGSNKAKSIRDAHEILSSVFKLEEADITALIDAVATDSSVFLSQFEIHSAQLKPFSVILQEANAELSRLNLSYEMLVMEYKLAKEKAEKLTQELQAANQRLLNLASRDGLTGVYNHQYFQESILREISRSDVTGLPFALILIDIDRFKMINDSYGHQRGDLVLQAVSRQLEQVTRQTDVLARYGGEEFAVILPDTPLSIGVAKAEAYRRSIEQMLVRAEDIQLRTTISLGVACYNPARPIKKDKLIEDADEGLYLSKRAGRNRVSTVY
jgi:diguanylate cyclase (GGDEF)-like protein